MLMEKSVCDSVGNQECKLNHCLLTYAPELKQPPPPMKTNATFAPGFRLSKLDVFVLLLGAVACIALAQVDVALSAAVAFLLGHFFLFCNVLRMARLYELVWSGIFVALSAGSLLASVPGWGLTFLLSFASTLLLAALQLRRPSYHGVYWRRINPNLPDWWRTNDGGIAREAGSIDTSQA